VTVLVLLLVEEMLMVLLTMAISNARLPPTLFFWRTCSPSRKTTPRILARPSLIPQTVLCSGVTPRRLGRVRWEVPLNTEYAPPSILPVSQNFTR
jgi:hypothetical protein